MVGRVDYISVAVRSWGSVNHGRVSLQNSWDSLWHAMLRDISNHVDSGSLELLLFFIIKEKMTSEGMKAPRLGITLLNRTVLSPSRILYLTG